MSVFTLARLMGTSVRMIELHCGALIDGAAADVTGRLNQLDDRLNEDTREGAEDV